MKALLDFSKQFNLHISKFLTKPLGKEKRVLDAMEYSLKNGGKRLRPYIMYEVAKMYGKSFEDIIDTALSLEMIHTYSLIHDDLPAMDNDTIRRGQPTCHIAFDEATAILAGDGLLTMAFEVLANQKLNNAKKIKLISMLSNAAGSYNGMIAGQSLDLQAKKATEIEQIETMKTGRLIKYAAQAGAVIADANKEDFLSISSYAQKIGQAFQISDDILDIKGDQTKMGKTLKKDIYQNKITFVALYGIEKAEQIAKDLISSAIEDISHFGDKSKNLQDLANFIINREN